MGFKRAQSTLVLALAYVTTQQKRALGFSVSFLAATARPTRTCTRTTWRALHDRLDLLQDTSNELPLSRSQLLRLIPPGIFGAVVFGAAAKPSFSALPTTEDYAFGTGSKVKKGTRKQTCTSKYQVPGNRYLVYNRWLCDDNDLIYQVRLVRHFPEI